MGVTEESDRCLLYRFTDLVPFHSLDIGPWTSKMAQQIKALAIKPIDLCLILRGYIVVKGNYSYNLYFDGQVTPMLGGNTYVHPVSKGKYILAIGLKHIGISVLINLM